MSKMTVADLKELLEGMDDDAPVRFAAQPSWPMEYSVDAESSLYSGGVLYLAEREQIGYLPDEVANEIW